MIDTADHIFAADGMSIHRSAVTEPWKCGILNSMKNLNADIKQHSFKPVYLLYGDEAFLKHSYKKNLKSAIVGEDDMNYAFFEGKDIDVDAVIDSAETMPFFSDYRLIIIEDSGWFKSTGASAQQETMCQYLDRMNDTARIVFIENEADKRGKLYKKVSSVGYVCELKHPDPKELLDWAARRLARDNKKITRTDMEFFLSRTGNDMERVKNELEKLISYVGDRDVVTAEDIEAVTTETEVNRVFDMVRAITTKHQAEAMRLYEDLLALKEPPMRIIYLIAKQFNQLLMVKDMVNAGKSKDEIASAIKVQPFIAGKLMQQVRPYEKRMLVSYVDRCVELEDAIKKGNMPERLAVELIICGS